MTEKEKEREMVEEKIKKYTEKVTKYYSGMVWDDKLNKPMNVFRVGNRDLKFDPEEPQFFDEERRDKQRKKTLQRILDLFYAIEDHEITMGR